MAEETTENDEPTREELYEEAQERDIPGRSSMTKSELAEALGHEEHDHVAELANWRKQNYEGGRPADD